MWILEGLVIWGDKVVCPQRPLEWDRFCQGLHPEPVGRPKAVARPRAVHHTLHARTMLRREAPWLTEADFRRIEAHDRPVRPLHTDFHDDTGSNDYSDEMETAGAEAVDMSAERAALRERYCGAEEN